MISLSTLLLLIHLIGLVLSVGAATAKIFLLLKCKSDFSFTRVYLSVVNSLTRQIVLGLILLTASGIGWLLLGEQFTLKLITKIVLVLVVWAIGPVIDKVVEPRFKALAEQPEKAGTPEFTTTYKNYLGLEITATGLFYIIILIWVLA